MTDRPTRVEVWRSPADRQWYARLLAPNGEELSVTEGHHNRADVLAIVDQIAPEGSVVRVLDQEPLRPASPKDDA